MNLCNRLSRQLTICLFCLFTVINLQAQISEGGLPPSFQFKSNLRSTEQAIQIPVNFSVEDLKAVDAWHVSQGAPLCIAKVIDTDFNIANDGDWITLPDGQQVWQLHLQAKDAIALIFYYSDFYIPEGGKLYIYNANKTQVLGAYTNRTHPQNGAFATELIAGDEAVLEYVPAPSGKEVLLRIDKVGYGYNHLSIEAPGAGQSGPCQVNINCEEGDSWQLQKKGIIQMMQLIDDATYICSASLINNTAKDKKPYVLSAFHCSQNMSGTKEATDEELNQWLFYFHEEHSGCDNESPILPIKTMVGCTRKVAIPVEYGSDGLLLLLNQNIPDDYDVFFNGWDRINKPSLSGVGIHHPAGDYMKISTYGKYPTESATWKNRDTGQTGAKNAHWNVIYDATPNGHGVTEGGSSGSPLFNSNGLIIGTLSGGNSSCEDPEGINLYGKLSFHWNKYSENNTGRMDLWLDPLQTGVTTLYGMTQTGETIGSNYKGPADLTYQETDNRDILLKWSAPLYDQLAGWGTSSRYNQYGLRGEPFYFAQKWDTSDLSPVHKKTITHVCIYPVSNVTYGIYIKQGNRIYEEDVIESDPDKFNSVKLKTPFVIDSNQELLVAIHVKEYGNDVYPAFVDEGPAIDGKGNIYSLDGKEWKTFAKEELNANTLLAINISSQDGELTSNYTASGMRRIPVTPAEPSETPRLSVKRSNVVSDLPESSLITAFPELTEYKVYQDQSPLATLPGSQTQYTVKNRISDVSLFQVSALYGKEESLPVSARIETSVSNELTPVKEEIDIHPHVFSEEVQIQNHQQVKVLEVYSSDGKLARKIQRPNNILNTSSLSTGVYIFRLSTEEGTKTIQGIKH